MLLTKNTRIIRSNHQRCCIKKAVLKIPLYSQEKHICWSLFLIKLQVFSLQLYLKETSTQVFSCEYCVIFKNTYFKEHLRMAASGLSINYLLTFGYICYYRLEFFCVLSASTLKTIFQCFVLIKQQAQHQLLKSKANEFN